MLRRTIVAIPKKNDINVTNEKILNRAKIDIINDVIRIEKMGNKTFFVFPQGEVSESLLSIDELDETLSKKGFIRTHANHMVNSRHLKNHFNSHTKWMALDNGEKIPLSTQYQHEENKQNRWLKRWIKKLFSHHTKTI